MCKNKVDKLLESCLCVLCKMLDTPHDELTLTNIRNLANNLGDLEVNIYNIHGEFKETLEWMVTQLEWNHRQQKNIPEGVPMEESPEMRKAKELLEKLQ